MKELENLKRRIRRSQDGNIASPIEADLCDVLVDVIDYLIAERKERENHDNQINIEEARINEAWKHDGTGPLGQD